MIIESFSAQDTFEAGRRLAESASAGEIYALLGDLGVGKTVFTKGFAEGLGITEPVCSPTFTILQIYEEGRLPLYHFDWYRIGDESELTDMGLDEYIGGDGVCLIEWHERAQDLLPRTALEVHLDPQEDGARLITLIPHGDWQVTHQ